MLAFGPAASAGAGAYSGLLSSSLEEEEEELEEDELDDSCSFEAASFIYSISARYFLRISGSSSLRCLSYSAILLFLSFS